MRLLYLLPVCLEIGCGRTGDPDSAFTSQTSTLQEDATIDSTDYEQQDPGYEVIPGTIQESYLAFSSCLDVQEKIQEAPSGIYQLYFLDVDDNPVLMAAYCDMDEEEGAWTLALNYVHQGNTNPSLVVHDDSFPLMGNGILGDDEQGTDYFGHVSPILLSEFPFTELRFYCVTTGTNRIVHFKSSDPGCIDYFTTGAGNCQNLGNEYTALSGHTGILPAGQSTDAAANQGAFAMTLGVLGSQGRANNWTLEDSGVMQWECDDDPDNSANSTIHRIWFR